MTTVQIKTPYQASVIACLISLLECAQRRRLAYMKGWRDRNASYIVEYFKNRKKNDPQFRLRCNMAVTISNTVAGRGGSAETIRRIVGCSLDDLKRHLESLFTPGMTWDNYGKRGWEIDHVKPVSSFDLTTPEGIFACWHYTNLQPLWRGENQIKEKK